MMHMFKRRYLAYALAAFLSACASTAPPANSLTVDALRRLPQQSYALTPEQAEITFAARPVAFPAVRGTFSAFDGEVEIVRAATDRIDVRALVDLSSVEMGNRNYENLVKSEGWFDVERHPTALFEGALEGWSGEGEGSVAGQITIKGITKPAEFTIRLNCEQIEDCPTDVVGFTGEIEVSRSEFGMTEWRRLVRDTVSLNFSGSLVATD